MSSLKSLFFIAVLAAAASGVYVALNKSNTESPVPPGVCQGYTGPPKIQMPTAQGAAGQFPSNASSGSRTSPAMPGFPSFSMNAPAAAASTAGPTPPPGDLAPPFVPPSAPPSVPPAVIGASGYPSAPGAPPAAPAPSSSAFGAPSSVAGGAAESSGSKMSSLSLRSDVPGGNAPAASTAMVPAATDPAAPSQPKGPSAGVESLMKNVESKLDEGRLADAHLMLSSLYGTSEVPPEHARQMTRLLDQMAATVIYSRQHLLEAPYRVQPGDTLERLADSHNVPPQLLARINGIRDSQSLTPGRELKMIRGPFSALIDLDRRELTLMLNGRYAGRFPIVAGADQPKLEGVYAVRDKRANPVVEGPGGAAPPRDPASQPGKLWIDLGNQISIQGTADPRSAGPTGDRGSICVGNQDMEDIFGILSVGSRVVIQR